MQATEGAVGGAVGGAMQENQNVPLGLLPGDINAVARNIPLGALPVSEATNDVEDPDVLVTIQYCPFGGSVLVQADRSSEEECFIEFEKKCHNKRSDSDSGKGHLITVSDISVSIFPRVCMATGVQLKIPKCFCIFTEMFLFYTDGLLASSTDTCHHRTNTRTSSTTSHYPTTACPSTTTTETASVSCEM